MHYGVREEIKKKWLPILVKIGMDKDYMYIIHPKKKFQDTIKIHIDFCILNLHIYKFTYSMRCADGDIMIMMSGIDHNPL